MSEAPRTITATELDELTPDERAALFAERIVSDWNDVPAEFREKVLSTARQLGKERRAKQVG